MKHVLSKGLMALCVAIAATGCAYHSQSPNVYYGGQTQREQMVRYATVESVRPVTITTHETGTGAAAGMMAGSVIGSLAAPNSRSGVGSMLGSIAGAVVGGVAGQSIERANNQKLGFEITYRYDNGQVSSLVQDAEVQFKVGDKVRVLSNGSTTRLTPL